MADILGSGIAFPLRVDARGGLALARGDDDVAGGDPPDPRHRAGRAADAARVRLRHPRLRLRDRSTPTRSAEIEYEIRVALDRWEPRIDVARRRASTSRASSDGELADRHHLPAARDERRAQPRLSLLPHPGGAREP